MYDLLKKLNTLVSAQVNELASHLPSLERKPDLDRQVAELRQRVAAALEHEDKLRAQVGALQTEIAGLDSRIDGAIQAGQEATARALLEEVQRLQKRLALAESDLRQHQQSAADLIVRVNELEAAVGDLKSSQVTTSTPAATSTDSVMHHRPPAEQPKGSITDFMPPVEPAAAVDSSSGPKADLSPAVPKSQGGSAPEAQHEPKPETPERKPWDPPRTAKEAAELAREDVKEKSERAKTGVEQVGGLLRDIQSRVNQRMSDLDRMLQEGGLSDDSPQPKPPAEPPSGKPKTTPDDDLSGRISRLSKPE